MSPQEIRHALNQGNATRLLKELAASGAFLSATNYSVSPLRMADREMVLRFLAFVLNDPAQYTSVEFDGFLSEVMGQLNKMAEPELASLSDRFVVAMRRARDLFEHYAFRKRTSLHGRRQPINKALFETWSVNLDALNEDEMTVLRNRSDRLTEKFMDLINTPDFLNAVSQGTGDIRKVQLRFSEIKRILSETLHDETLAN